VFFLENFLCVGGIGVRYRMKLFLYSVGICSIIGSACFTGSVYAQSSYPGLVAPKQKNNKSTSPEKKPSSYQGLFSGGSDDVDKKKNSQQLTQKPYQEIEDERRLTKEKQMQKRLDALYPQSYPKQKTPEKISKQTEGRKLLEHKQTILGNKSLLEEQFQDAATKQSFPAELQELARKYMPKNLEEDVQQIAELEVTYQKFIEAQKQIKLPEETLKWLKYIKVEPGEMNPVEKQTKNRVEQMFTMLQGDKDRKTRKQHVKKVKGELGKMMDLYHLKKSAPKSVLKNLGMPDNYIDIQYEGYDASIKRLRLALKELRKY